MSKEEGPKAKAQREMRERRYAETEARAAAAKKAAKPKAKK